MDTGSLNYSWSLKLIDSFVQLGVHQVVISPGSRSTPLALACQKHPEIEVWVQIDERCAAFFALGLAQQNLEASPVILICTSGSAVANWYPAVVEANHSYAPLLLLSADRPAELQNCGANQTINQTDIFSTQVRDTKTIEVSQDTDFLQICTSSFQASLYPKAGPVHLNIQISEPLLPVLQDKSTLNQTINQLTSHILQKNKLIKHHDNKLDLNHQQINPVIINKISTQLNLPKGLIICGRMTLSESQSLTPILKKLLQQFNCPLLLDPLSNLRFDKQLKDHAIVNYHQSINSDALIKEQPDWIIRFGQFPVSKALLGYIFALKENKSKTIQILINSYNDKLDPTHSTDYFVHTSPQKFCDDIVNQRQITNYEQAQSFDSSRSNGSSKIAWLNLWQSIEQQSTQKITQILTQSEQLFEGHVINLLLKHLPHQSLVYSGNSMAIRDFDTFMTAKNLTSEETRLFANRGTSGIDGNLSTFFGHVVNHKTNHDNEQKVNKNSNQACAAQAYAAIVLGDLSFYHDMNALLIAKKLQHLGYQASIIVLNNNGGGIFNYLPQHQLDDFDFLFNTAPQLNFEHSAKLYDLAYTKIETRKRLEDELPELMQTSGIHLIEVIIDQQNSVKSHALLQQDR